jgi:hypothetical protein
MSLRKFNTDRRSGETIGIGDAFITIERATTGKVSLVIMAPDSMKIDIPKDRPDLCRCGAEAFGDASGMCWRCFKAEMED